MDISTYRHVLLLFMRDYKFLLDTHLQPEQIVHSADNDVHCGCVPSLGPQEVLEICPEEILS